MYDVFISKNTKDLPRIRELISFFDRNGIKYFESERHLVGIGDANYGRRISDALATSRNMLVICSKNENASGENGNSKWVHHEWTVFHNEILSGRKPGGANIIVLTLDGLTAEDLPLDLRVYQYFPLQKFLSTENLSYVKPGSFFHEDRRPSWNFSRLWKKIRTVLVSVVAASVLAVLYFHVTGKQEAIPVAPPQPVVEQQTQPAMKQQTSAGNTASVKVTAPVKEPAPAQEAASAVSPAPVSQPKNESRTVVKQSLKDKADSGDPASCYELAVNYQNGINGVSRDLVNAFVYMKSAADAGYVKAFRPLAEMYHGGRGVSKDREIAAYWYKLAADNGDVKASRILNNM